MLKPETYRHPEPKRRLPLPPEIEGSIWHKSAARSLGRVLEVIAAWVIFAVALAFLIGPVIAKGMRRNKARDDRWLAESDADFDEHADEAMELARIPREATLNHIARAMAADVDREWADMNGSAS